MKRGVWSCMALAIAAGVPLLARAEPASPPASMRAASPGAGVHSPRSGAPDSKPAGRDGRPPDVDLRRVRWTERGALAPVVGGGEALLTLDMDLQRAASKLLLAANPMAGAVILVHAPSGRVLVWADRQRGAGSGGVLLDRRAPAGSLFKIVTAAALLERAHVSPERMVCHSGGMHGIERRHLEPPPEGDPDVVCAPFWQALGHSRNAVFAQLVTRDLMRSDLVDMAERFGFNQPAPFATELAVGTLRVPYGDLDVARTATGFRNSTLTPLGALTLAYTIANGGESAEIEIVKSAGSWRAPKQRRTVARVIDYVTAVRVRRMMELTVSGGTSFEAFSDPDGDPYLRGVRVAGKTGTLKGRSDAPTTSWFVGFAPSRNPEVVVSVLLANGNVWRRKANEVARDMLRTWFAARGRPGITAPAEVEG